MKLIVFFKTPDAVDAVIDQLPPEEHDAAMETVEKFVKYGEAVSIEFDTEAGTATVLRR